MEKVTSLARLLSSYISGSSRIFTLWISCLRFLHCCLWLLGGLLLAASPTQAEVEAGDILVVDPNAGTRCLELIVGVPPFPCGALFVVNPKTGQRTVLSDFGDPAQGSLGNGDLTGVAVGRAGQIFVTALFSGDPADVGGALFRVDPRTGNRTVLSNFSQGTIQGNLYNGLAVDASGKVLANLQGPLAGIVRVKPKTDARMLVSDFSNPAQGETLGSTAMTDLTVEHSGKILMGTYIFTNNNTSQRSAIFRVNPATGRRRLLSDFTNPAQGTDMADLTLQFSTGLAVETSGQILVAAGGSNEPRDLLLRIDPKTGQRTVLSDFANPAQGNLGVSLHGVAVEESGKVIVGVGNAEIGSADATLLFRVNPKTGRRALLSDSDNLAQGPPFHAVIYIAVVPKDSNEDYESDAEDHD